MFYRHAGDKFIFVLIGLALLIYVSYKPQYQLSSKMPPGFFSAAKASSSVKGTERRIAEAYWESARMDVQWKYPHDSTLPIDPPVEFRVTAAALGGEASDAGMRLLYWHRLQEVWLLPDSWTRHYEWNFSWASDPTASGAQWIKERFDRLFTFH